MSDWVFTTGNVIDEKYEIVSLLGKGGMGTVYKATQRELGRIVAVKVLQSGLADDAESWSRFEREAMALSKLSHRNIATFYNYGVWQDRVPYIAMEFLEGHSLADIIVKESSLDWKRSLKIAMQVCDAMNFAHAAGIVHRDLKPSNIVLLNEKDSELVKVMDFGLAKLVTPDGKEAQKLTQTGMLVGSVQYLSPEQSKGLRADHRSDIYALGCVLFECLTGEAPFSAHNPIGIIHKHANEPPRIPSSLLQQKLPPGLDDVLLKTLAKDPQDRYQSMAELSSDLKEVLLGTGNLSIQATKYKDSAQDQIKSTNRNRFFAIIVITLIISATAVAGIQFMRSRQSQLSDSLNHPLDPKVDYEAAKKEFDKAAVLLAEEDNHGAIEHLKACISLVDTSVKQKDIVLKLQALDQTGNCLINLNELTKAGDTFTNLKEIVEKELNPQSKSRHLDRKTACTWMLHAYSNMVNLALRKKDLNSAESSVASFDQFSNKYSKLLPQMRQSFLALQSTLLEAKGKKKEAITVAEQIRQNVRKDLGPANYRFYLDNLFHLIRLNIDSRDSDAALAELRQEYLNCLSTYQPQYMIDIGHQLNVMADLEMSNGKLDADAMKFWSSARRILIRRQLWAFLHEISYDAILFVPFLELDVMPDPADAATASSTFLKGMKNKKEQVPNKTLETKGVASQQGIGRWLARSQGVEAALSFLTDVKSTYKDQKLNSKKFYLNTLGEMVLIASMAKHPDDNFPERKELAEIVSTDKSITSEMKGCALCSLAGWELAMSRYPAAQARFEEAADVLKDGKPVSNSDAESYAYIQIARIYDIEKNYARAERYYWQTLVSVKKRRKGNQQAYEHWLQACKKMADHFAPGKHKEFFASIQKNQKDSRI